MVMGYRLFVENYELRTMIYELSPIPDKLKTKNYNL